MRLLTHNSLKCLLKEAPEGFPLGLEVIEMEVKETECNVEFMKRILPSLHWPGVLIAAEAINLNGMPAEFSVALLDDNDFLQAAHRLLLDVHIKTGNLICPDTKRKFPIEAGIPNLM